MGLKGMRGATLDYNWTAVFGPALQPDYPALLEYISLRNIIRSSCTDKK